MALSSQERRRLLAASHHVQTVVTIAGGPLAPATLSHVRTALRSHDLIKVRIGTEDRREFADTARALAEQVPCELVKAIGRVAILYAAPAAADDASAPD